MQEDCEGHARCASKVRLCGKKRGGGKGDKIKRDGEEKKKDARTEEEGNGICKVGASTHFLLRWISIALHTIAILRGA